MVYLYILLYYVGTYMGFSNTHLKSDTHAMAHIIINV